MEEEDIQIQMQEDEMLSKIEDFFHVVPLGEKSLDFGKILSTDTSVKILEAVYNSDPKVGLSASEISELIGVGRTTVIYHLGRMVDKGLVRINPVLENENSWNRFWGYFKSGDAEVTREQFKKLHESRMNGVKLFVATKKGFLVLPSTDLKESKTMVREALNTIVNPVLERDYRSLRKASSLLGTIGILLIAMSFLIQMPFFHAPAEVGFQADALGRSTGLREGMPLQPPMQNETTAAPLYAESAMEDMEKNKKLTAEGEMAITTTEPDETKEPVLLPITESESFVGSPQLSRVFLYTGTLLLGSFIGFLAYSLLRKRQ